MATNEQLQELGEIVKFWSKLEKECRVQVYERDGVEFPYVLIGSDELPDGINKRGNVAFTYMWYDDRFEYLFNPKKALQEAKGWCFVFRENVPEDYLELVLLHEYAEKYNGGNHVDAAKKEYAEAEKYGQEFLEGFMLWNIENDKDFAFQSVEHYDFYKQLWPENCRHVIEKYKDDRKIELKPLEKAAGE